MKTYVLYHGGGCTDGLGSKFAAWMKFGDKAVYIPVQYGEPVPVMDNIQKFSELELDEKFKFADNKWYVKTGDDDAEPIGYDVAGKYTALTVSPDTPVISHVEVYILDFSYPLDVLNELKKHVKKLVILDHHKTSQEALKGFPDAIFDMTKSGALLSWEYFHPGKEVPMLIRNVSDRDLWQFKLDNTNEVHAALGIIGDHMPTWAAAIASPAEYIGLVEMGTILLRDVHSKVDSMLKNVVLLPYKGYKVGVINTNVLFSEIGAAICKELGVDFSMTYFVKGDGEAVFSFRSLQDGGLDVGEIAKGLGGGGHKNASGARAPLSFVADLHAGKL